MQGSLRQRGPDTWQGRVSVGRHPLTGRYRYVNRTIRGGKRTVQRAAAQLINEVEHGGHREAAKGSLAQLLDQTRSSTVGTARLLGAPWLSCWISG
jgi:hypothetical protein